jgi:hypothetical protein
MTALFFPTVLGLVDVKALVEELGAAEVLDAELSAERTFKNSSCTDTESLVRLKSCTKGDDAG